MVLLRSSPRETPGLVRAGTAGPDQPRASHDCGEPSGTQRRSYTDVRPCPRVARSARQLRNRRRLA